MFLLTIDKPDAVAVSADLMTLVAHADIVAHERLVWHNTNESPIEGHLDKTAFSGGSHYRIMSVAVL